MAEYIEREALLAKAQTGWVLLGFEDDAVSVDDIESIPAADVEPVVRCKDCKYQDDCEQMVEFTVRGLRVFSISHKVNFCSYGERKEG